MSTAAKRKKKSSKALDKIVIRRPVPSPEVLQDMEPSAPASAAPAQPPTEINPEFEQKPLAELNLHTSEDFHGGTEKTFSMPSLQGGGGAQQQRSGALQQAGQAPKSDAGHQSPQQQGGGGAGSKDVVQSGGAQQHNEGGGGVAQQQHGAPQQQGAGGGVQQQQRSAPQQLEAAPQQNDATQQQEAQHIDLLKRFHMGGLENEERGDVRELGRNVKTGGSGSHMGVGGYNTAQVVDLKTKRPQRPDLKRLQTEFYRILEMLAEEKTKYFDPSLVGSMAKAEYNVKKMALRRYEGKPPTRYKAPRVREAVVLVLDNSGSMASWADMLRAMAELAAKRRDVEVYLAPNGYVEEQIAPVKRKVKYDEFMKKMSGRKIIYVGDFDGTNTPVELSWRNEVIWIAPEDRYRRFLSHSWVKYDESKYKGAFVRTFTIDSTMKALKKVLGGTKWIDMCMKCEDE